MTASLPNNQNGPSGFNTDGFVYPQFIGGQLRAPNTQDIYNEGTRWQNDAVSPAAQYYTTGAGNWFEYPNSAFGVSSVTGTANQILATPTTGNVVLSLIGPYTPATYTAHGVLIGEGTGSIVATAAGTTGQGLVGNTGADPTWTGSPSYSGTVTAGTGFTATTGNLTLSGVGSGLVTTPTVVAAAASPQTANGRIVDVTFSSVSIAAGATQSFVIANTAVPASTSSYQLSMVGATAGSALSIVSVTNVAATSTTIVVTNGTGATTTIANIRFTMTFLN